MFTYSYTIFKIHIRNQQLEVPLYQCNFLKNIIIISHFNFNFQHQFNCFYYKFAINFTVTPNTLKHFKNYF